MELLHRVLGKALNRARPTRPLHVKRLSKEKTNRITKEKGFIALPVVVSKLKE